MDDDTARSERIQELADDYDPTVTGSCDNNAARSAFAIAHVQGQYDWHEDYAFADFMADFMHLCNVLDVDFDEALASARVHYDAEMDGVL